MIPIQKEPEDLIRDPLIGGSYERCCFCREETDHWTDLKNRKEGEQVACCPKCATNHRPSQVPSKDKWCDDLLAKALNKGFQKVYVGPVGKTKFSQNSCSFDGHVFKLQDRVPKLPFKTMGAIFHSGGGKVPTRWVVDGDQQCWSNDTADHELIHVSKEYLEEQFECDEERESFCRMLGIKAPRPDWIQTALDEGWTPPKGYDFSKWR